MEGVFNILRRSILPLGWLGRLIIFFTSSFLLFLLFAAFLVFWLGHQLSKEHSGLSVWRWVNLFNASFCRNLRQVSVQHLKDVVPINSYTLLLLVFPLDESHHRLVASVILRTVVLFTTFKLVLFRFLVWKLVCSCVFLNSLQNFIVG